jgi:DNA-binding MarR family transcriptional regulator
MELRELVRQLISISVIHRCQITRSAAKVGLYFGQPSILQYVIDNPGCSQKDLAEANHISPASAAVSLKRIEKAGLITRTPDADDSRKNHLHVTPKGMDALKQFRKICDTTDKEMFKGFSQEDMDTLHSLLTRLHDNLDSKSFSPKEINALLKQAEEGDNENAS